MCGGLRLGGIVHRRLQRVGAVVGRVTVPPLRRWRRAYDLTRRLRGCGRYGLLQREPRREEPLEMRTARPSRHKSGAKHAAGQGLALF